ncbi:tRNA (adenosine(37)-N6)-dimethylallyltransferase MiaA [Brumimicrobium salinarum]|uniref:tRNA dimethylallyltransferase n=1 Tax=Brumimicrobium salinarum TaxID=2058658 RepID=A0A2I0R1L9_9FLAO|nr:tRNA (adenosine(37)-N6)-dimethylallyltransferase MiaA [Brumimicrobium salinarum]PKR80478.1 tRNA (adenosine(37)-N6)-dimethylallyltransferase MiaA [Brumimicrobium salinarum]
MKKLIVIAGPTASGKTSLAVAVAKQLKAPIISADSRQFYKELSIGTAKPTKEEMQGVPHYFVDSHSIHTPLTAGQFEKEALAKVNELFKTNEFIVIVGGSGMFINALIYGTDQLPHDPKIRAFWNDKLEHYGIEYLQEELKKVDLEYFQNSDIQNPVRIIRALEVFEITGTPYSQLRNQKKKTPRFPTDFYVLDHPREVLYERINHRVDLMIENGLIDEVRANKKHQKLQPLNTVGYKEIFEYLDYNISYEKAIELVKQNTRRYAKRQLTWFRKIEDAQWIKPNALDEMTQLICKNV